MRPVCQKLPHHQMQILVNFEIEVTCIQQCLRDTIQWLLLSRFLVSFTDILACSGTQMKLMQRLISKNTRCRLKLLTSIYTQKNNWRILKFIWLYTILEIYFSNKLFLSLVELSLCNSQKCKLKFTGHWLWYSTTPNVPTLTTQSSQAKILALSIFAATFTRSVLMF